MANCDSFPLETLLREIDGGTTQLPEFQRDWTWDDNRIRGILASLTHGYPMGAVMRLDYNYEAVHLQHRVFEGAPAQIAVGPRYLVLDGQQRLTSMYCALFSSNPVKTKNDKGNEIYRFYYLDMNGCFDEQEDRIEAVLSVPSDRVVRSDFNRVIDLDLSDRTLEYKEEMFPLNIVFNNNEREDWLLGYIGYYGNDPDHVAKYIKFRNEVINNICNYMLPVITLDSNTSREAVCKVFENVNTGGVELTVFDLLTATYAAEDFDLRKDWNECRDIIYGKDEPLSTDVMQDVNETDFLTAITLYTNYMSANKTTSCKRRDILRLTCDEYKANRDALLEGYRISREFLMTQCVFLKRDLPYVTQLTPLAAICAVIGRDVYNKPMTQEKLARWFWCGIFGEMYGSATETRYANDIEDVIDDIEGRASQNRTINAAVFSATRLLTLKSRASAAYKGILALLYKENCLDFMRGAIVSNMRTMESVPDIHHIFPKAHCIDKGYPELKWNSIVNKTPLLSISNQNIGGRAPSVYCDRIMREAHIDQDALRSRVKSNFINYDLFIADDFDGYFIDRAKQLIGLIEKAMGKEVADKNSAETMVQFGASLL